MFRCSRKNRIKSKGEEAQVRPQWFQDDPEPRGKLFSIRAPRTVVGVLILVNIIIYIVQNIFRSTQGVDPLIEHLGLDCSKMLTGTFFLYLYQFITSQFLHSGIFHILFNMIVLWFFGRDLEGLLGSRRFLFLYLTSGVVGGIACVVTDSQSHVVGASGALYGIVVYYAMTWPTRRVHILLFPFMVPMRVMHMALLFVGISLFSGLFSQGDGIAHFGHLGGALFGFLFHRYGRRWETAVDQVKERRKQRDRDKEIRRETEVDRLLKKIHEEGIGSLTPSERSFLNETSRKIRNGRK